MPSLSRRKTTKRRGAIAVLAALMVVVVIIVTAFAVDLGWLYVARADAQRAADAAAMASAWELASEDKLKGHYLTTYYNMREMARTYGGQHNDVINEGTTVQRNFLNLPAGDIVIGRLNNPSDLTEALDLTNPFNYNAVTVRVRRTAQRNSPVGLTFTRVFGINSADVSAEATAILQDRISGFKVTGDTGNSSLIPFAVEVNTWTALLAGSGPDTYFFNSGSGAITSGSDGLRELDMFPGSGGNGSGNGGAGGSQIVSGNFGTVNIGPSNNSTNHIREQIRNGPSQADLAHHGGELALNPTTGHLNLSGDTGISTGMQPALDDILGLPKTIFLYDQVTGNGATANFRIVGFAGVRILDHRLTGANKYIRIQPAVVVDQTAVHGSTGQSYEVYQPVILVR